MRRLVPVLFLSLSSSSCTGTEPTTDPTPDRPPVATVEAEPNAVRETDGPEYFLAVASQTGVEHCPDGHGETQWLAVEPTLGWTPASGAAAADLDALMDLPVLARGSAGPAPDPPLLGVEPIPCPVMQMRSDWVSTPRGVRVRRTSPTAAGHFVATSVRRLDELTVRAEGQELVASFVNPLPFSLTGVRLRMHYEGCYGKPGSTSLSSEPIALEPGETATHRFPRIAERDHQGQRKGGPSAREHLAAALVVEIGGSEGPADAKVWVDLDVSLAKLGLVLECDR